jgi:hypothetical protein
MAVCYGAGVDSTAMLVALKQDSLRPNIITFADLSAEKPPTLEHLLYSAFRLDLSALRFGMVSIGNGIRITVFRW